MAENEKYSDDEAAFPLRLVQVAVEAAAPSFYTYLARSPLAEAVEVGQTIVVPLGSRKTVGYVMAVKVAEKPVSPRLKEIIEIIRHEPLFGPSLSRLISFIANYYLYPPGLFAKELLPRDLSPGLDKIAEQHNEARPLPRPFKGDSTVLFARIDQAGAAGKAVTANAKENFDPALHDIRSEKQVELN